MSRTPILAVSLVVGCAATLWLLWGNTDPLVGAAPQVSAADEDGGEGLLAIEPTATRNVESAAPPAVDPPTQPLAATSSCSVSGTVVDPAHRPVPDIEIVLTHLRDRPRFTLPETRSTTSDEKGRYHFDDLPPSEPIRIDVDPASLPTGFLGPWRGRNPLPDGETVWPFGYDSGEIDLPGAGEVTYDVRLFRTGRVFGYVKDADLQPIPRTQIRFGTWGRVPASGLPLDIHADDHGYFTADLYPGQYRRYVYPSRKGFDFDAGPLSTVVPLDFRLAEGEVLDMGDVVLGGPGKRVTGRVVDRSGDPVVDLFVMAYYNEPYADGNGTHGWSSILCLAQTDEEGVYVLESLPPARIGVFVGPWDFKPGRPVGAFRLAKYTETMYFDLREPEEDWVAPETVAWVSHPFSLIGEVSLPEEYESRRRDIFVSVELMEEDTEGEYEPVFIKQATPRTLALEEDSTFVWKCETPFPPVVIRILTRKRAELRSWVVAPTRDSQHEEKIELTVEELAKVF